MLEIVRRHLAAYSSSDWSDFKSLVVSDVVYEDKACRLRAIGAEQYLIAAQSWKTAFPDLRCAMTRGYAAADHVAVEVEWVGTHRGPFDGQFGSLAASYRRVRFSSAMIINARDGRIAECSHYYDLYSVLVQLGANANRSSYAIPSVMT